jgi:hypothetical protein
LVILLVGLTLDSLLLFTLSIERESRACIFILCIEECIKRVDRGGNICCWRSWSNLLNNQDHGRVEWCHTINVGRHSHIRTEGSFQVCDLGVLAVVSLCRADRRANTS